MSERQSIRAKSEPLTLIKHMDNIKDHIKQFIIQRYLAGKEREPLKSDDSFLEKGIVDSIGVIELIGFIQREYKIDIKVPEIVPENIDTLNNLEKFILKKKGTG